MLDRTRDRREYNVRRGRPTGMSRTLVSVSVLVLLGVVAVLVLATIPALLGLVAGDPAALAVTVLALVTLAAAYAVGARSRRWLANPYW